MSSQELINVAEKERNSGVVENDDLGSAAFAETTDFLSATSIELISDLEILLWQGV